MKIWPHTREKNDKLWNEYLFRMFFKNATIIVITMKSGNRKIFILFRMFIIIFSESGEHAR